MISPACCASAWSCAGKPNTANVDLRNACGCTQTSATFFQQIALGAGSSFLLCTSSLVWYSAAALH
eukprot:9671165-Lingulodinium_polyedra.AAC.1